MAELDIAKSTTTDLSGNVSDFSVASQTPDSAGAQGETYWDYSDAAENLGYYKAIPELKSAIDSLAIWTAGKGYETDTGTQVILDHISGWGEDSFSSICQNLIVQKKIFGDAYAEIIRRDRKSVV